MPKSLQGRNTVLLSTITQKTLKSLMASIYDLPAEILHEILGQLNKSALFSLGFTSHAMLATTRPYFFKQIVLSNTNIEFFLSTLGSSSWSSIFPAVQYLTLGGPGFPLDRKFEYEPENYNGIAARLRGIHYLCLRNVDWSKLPRPFAHALLEMEVEHLDVWVGNLTVTCSQFPTIVNSIKFNVLSLSEQSYNYADMIPIMHYSQEHIQIIQAHSTKILNTFLSWIEGVDPAPPIANLCILLPIHEDSSYGEAVTQLISRGAVKGLRIAFHTGTPSSFRFDTASMSSIRVIILDGGPISFGYTNDHLTTLAFLFEQFNTLPLEELHIVIAPVTLELLTRPKKNMITLDAAGFLGLKKLLVTLEVRIVRVDPYSQFMIRKFVEGGPFCKFYARGIVECKQTRRF